MLAGSVTSAGMTSPAGARESDHHELRSTSIPCDALYRHGTLAALSTRPDDWRGEEVDDWTTERMDTERSRPDAGHGRPRVLQDDVVSLDNEDNESTRPSSVSFSNASNKDATCSGSYMHLRSKTSRSVLWQAELTFIHNITDINSSN